MLPLTRWTIENTLWCGAMQAGDTSIKDSSDEIAAELRVREEKTYATTDESKRDINISLNIWRQSLETENKKLKEVLPVVRCRYESLLKQRNILVEKINKLRESLDLTTYTTKSDSVETAFDVKTANSFSLESALEYSNVSTCSPLPSSQVEPHLQ
ncbi:hypothetical protein KIN20_025980 [Parelaphostrongylus tenuis]|uniref:Uncharacterized protein n=1 Tax=Parelaphostrongylus tenuis TaxID=148309 RepID=A0AAD5N9D7_PARTN|nr:hypothetical protein KIN20_025980 [Parelaphostrongylus tenuis]